MRRGWGGGTPPNSIHAAAWLWKRVLALALEGDGEAATSVGERELWPVGGGNTPRKKRMYLTFPSVLDCSGLFCIVMVSLRAPRSRPGGPQLQVCL